MLFLNLVFMAGLAAVAAPIILHLLNRRSAKTLDWGATRFLHDALTSRRRRVLIEQILLLALRCMLIALVVLAMARPLADAQSRVPWLLIVILMLGGIGCLAAACACWDFRRWRHVLLATAVGLLVIACFSTYLERVFEFRRFGGGAPKDVVIIMDTSASMMRQRDGITLFRQAAREASEAARTAPEGTAFLLMTGGPAPAPILTAPTRDTEEVAEAIETLKPAAGTMDVPAALEQALYLLAQGENPGKQILLYTDAQQHGWRLGDQGTWRSLSDRIDALPIPPQIILRRLQTARDLRNLAVETIELSRPLIGTDREVGIDVAVLNTGTEAMTPAGVTLAIGSNTLRKVVGQILPGASERVQFTHRFVTVGGHTVSAIVDVDDDIPADNTASRALTAVDHADVLILDGNPAGRFIDSAGAYVALALAPSVDFFESRRAKSPPFMIRPSRIAAPEFASGNMTLDNFDLVIAADVPRLPGKSARKLEAFVQAGGSLLVAPGRRAQPQFYNAWQQNNGTPLMPAALVHRQTVTPGTDGMRLAPGTFVHPVLATLADVLPEELTSIVINEVWTLRPRNPEASHAVGARLRNGLPFFLSHGVGDGQVAMTAIALDTHDSNLPSMQAFVLLLHEILYAETARALPALHQPARRETRITIEGSVKLDPRIAVAGETITAPVAAPGAARLEARLQFDEERATISVTGAQVPGIYHLELPERLRGFLKGALDDSGSISFTIQADGREGMVKPLGDQALKQLPESIAVTPADTAEAVAGIMHGEGSGAEFWRSLALAALVLASAEVILTRWISQGRQLPAETRFRKAGGTQLS